MWRVRCQEGSSEGAQKRVRKVERGRALRVSILEGVGGTIGGATGGEMVVWRGGFSGCKHTAFKRGTFGFVESEDGVNTYLSRG